jgi:hypothetical protein
MGCSQGPAGRPESNFFTMDCSRKFQSDGPQGRGYKGRKSQKDGPQGRGYNEIQASWSRVRYDKSFGGSFI